jgi:hypothetical protein
MSKLGTSFCICNSTTNYLKITFTFKEASKLYFESALFVMPGQTMGWTVYLVIIFCEPEPLARNSHVLSNDGSYHGERNVSIKNRLILKSNSKKVYGIMKMKISRHLPWKPTITHFFFLSCLIIHTQRTWSECHQISIDCAVNRYHCISKALLIRKLSHWLGGCWLILICSEKKKYS